MKIRKRITLVFTALLGVVIFILCGIIYTLSANTRENLFYNQLSERVTISENFFLERDQVSEEVETTIREKFLNTLPQEIEYYGKLEDFHEKSPDSILNRLPEDYKSMLSKNGEVKWMKDTDQGIARVYEINEVEYVVLVIANDIYGWAYLSQLRNILIGSLLISLLLCYLLSNYFSRKVLKPISEKIQKANLISAKNLDLRLTVYNEHDELGMLALSFNNLLDRLQAAFELQKNFVRYASHELKNPLAGIIGETEISLLKERSNNENVQTIQKVNQIAEKMNIIIQQFLQLSRLEGGRHALDEIALDEVLMQVISDFAQLENEIHRIDFQINEKVNQEHLLIKGDAVLLQNAFYNIIENALKFSDPNTVVHVTLSQHPDGVVFVQVSDQGIGVPQEDLEKVFEPLYRAQNTADTNGSGLGLAIVKRVFELHEFQIDFQTKVGVGTTFTVSLTKS